MTCDHCVVELLTSTMATEARTATAQTTPESAGRAPAGTARSILSMALVEHGSGRPVSPRLLEAIEPTKLASAAELMNLGVLWRAAQVPERALACYRLAQLVGLDSPELWTNMGNALKDLGRLEQSCVAHRRAVALDPASQLASHNYGIALQAAGHAVEAVEVLRAAAAMPGNAAHRCEWDLARALLALGRYEEGWTLYRSRWHQPGHVNPYPSLPEWRGEPLDGRHLLLWSEQGFGDVIQCLRYLEPLRARADAGKLTVAVQAPMVDLVRRSFPGLEVVPREEASAAVDLQASILDLPGLLGCNDPSAVPGAGGYLAQTPLPAGFPDMRTRFPARLHVGIIWSGSVTFKENARRAIPAAPMIEHLALPGVQLYSLQVGPPAAELAQCRAARGVVDLGPSLANFDVTAAVIGALDLVVMTDSSVAHLCGALGRDVWVMLARPSHWLWGLEGDTTRWYGSMRFFRQSVAGDWGGTLDRVAAALMERLAAPVGAQTT